MACSLAAHARADRWDDRWRDGLKDSPAIAEAPQSGTAIAELARSQVEKRKLIEKGGASEPARTNQMKWTPTGCPHDRDG